jgi:hypothetical protein
MEYSSRWVRITRPHRVKMHVVRVSHYVVSEDSGLLEYGTVFLGHDLEDLNSWLKFVNL